MARIRRVVRRVQTTRSPYFDEQLWPVAIALVALGGFLIALSVAHQPLSGVAWYRTAWPSLIGIPVVLAVAIIAMAVVDSRVIRRSLQLSLVLCAIAHVAMVVQMFRTQLYSGGLAQNRREQAVIEKRLLKFVPEYQPTQLVPEEDRPRQDFEKPVEAETPLPTPEPEKIVRQPTEQEQSPAQPQPVPVPEQKLTTEPNVAERQRPNEVAPRLAAQTSRLSRQMQPSSARQSQPVDLPAAERQLAAKAEALPAAASIERQAAESAVPAQPRAEAATTHRENRESSIARRTNETSPTAAPSAEAKKGRTVTEPIVPQQRQVATTPQDTPLPQRAPEGAQPTRMATTRATANAPPIRQAEQRAPETADDASARAQNSVARAEPKTGPATEAATNSKLAPRQKLAATGSVASSVPVESASKAISSTSQRNPAAEASKLALQRGESGTTAGRRSPNFDSALPGGQSPALVASAAARRAEATQREPAGDAISPTASARIARSRAGGEMPTATVKAEQLELATAAGAREIAEVTASSGAAVTRAAADARRDAVTAAKGSGEIDFGPTQIVAEVGSGRAAGGGQPELNLQSLATAPITRRSGSAPTAPASIDAKATTEGAPAPVEASDAGQPLAQAAPAALAATRIANQSTVHPSAAGRSGSPAARDAGSAVVETRLGRVQPSAGDPPASQSADNLEAAAAGETTRRAAVMAPSGGATNVVEIPEVGPHSAVAQAGVDHAATGTALARATRSQGEALAVDIAAPVGPGGLGTDFSPEVGMPSRPARSDSVNVELRAARFLRSQVGGLPAVSTVAVIPTEAFSSRAARVRGEERAGGRGTTSPETEEAIERGLAFLARYQRADGAWSLQGFPEGASLESDTAATALALLAFQGAGYNHREFQYKDVVRGGIAHLLKSQKENGDLFVPLGDSSNASVWLYSHSLAAIAICESFGMTQDPALREPAQRAIDFIVAGQHAQRGGWRYAPGVGSDTSVSGWMMMALKSGELAGLDVPPATYQRIGRWLDDAQQSPSEPHLYRYNPHAPDTVEQRHGRVASKTMTAVGLLMRLYVGWRRDDPRMARGAAFLVENLPANGTARDPLRDTYYWYYATQVMAHVGGEPWRAWMNRLHPLLVNSQTRQGPYVGSWDPQAPIADRWGPHAGRIYLTTMNLLSLEVQYRKLPLYEDVARER